jgi:hypothetical protein
MYDNIEEVIIHQGQYPKEISITTKSTDLSLEFFTLDVKKD